jgi:hypothetical protein
VVQRYSSKSGFSLEAIENGSRLTAGAALYCAAAAAAAIVLGVGEVKVGRVNCSKSVNKMKEIFFCF